MFDHKLHSPQFAVVADGVGERGGGGFGHGLYRRIATVSHAIEISSHDVTSCRRRTGIRGAVKNNPRMKAAARELKDRWLVQLAAAYAPERPPLSVVSPPARENPKSE